MEKAQKDAALNLRIPVALRVDLERLAAKEDRELSNLVRRALTQYVEAEGIRESLAKGHE